MSFRITGNMMFKKLLANVRTSTTILGQLQEQMVSLRRINRPSDDPTAASRAAALKTSEHDYRQYMSNIDEATGTLDFSASVLESISEQIVAVRGKVLAAINPTADAASRDVTGTEIDDILGSILSQANSQRAGVYIFGGTQTGTQPFDIANKTPAGIEEVAFRGDAGRIRYAVGLAHLVEINEDPVEVFMPRGEVNGVFQTLIDVRKILQNKEGLGDGEVGKLLSAKLTNIDLAHDDVVRAIGRVGTRSRSLRIRRDLYSKAEINSIARRSELEDADIADVALRLKNQQVIFQVVLAGSAAVYNSSLTEFLR